MSVRDRTLFRRGEDKPGYCGADTSSDECDRVRTKDLSGYGYFRGRIIVGALGDPRGHDTTELADLQLSVASGAMPGGDLAVVSLEGVLDTQALQRLGGSLFDAQAVFVCHDAHSGKLAAPVLGMFTRECSPDAVVGFDAGLLGMQADLTNHRLSAEWLRAGPALELLGNGLSYAHLLRSVTIGLPFDLRSHLHGNRTSSAPSRTSFGAGLRASAFYRTPSWETRLEVRYRTSLAGGAGVAHDNVVNAELRLLHNFFLVDALIVQAGVSVRGIWAQRPLDAFVPWATQDKRWGAFAGVYFGWLSEPPNL